MRIEVAYGSTKLFADMPKGNLLGVLKPLPVFAGVDERSLLARALGEPAAMIPASLSGRKVAIVVDDNTRSAPTREILQPLLKRIEAAGCSENNITIIFACGIHRAVRAEEGERILGKDIWEKYEVVSHDPGSPDLVEVGTTRTYGNRVSVNRKYAEADYKILTGDVELHYYAGYGGGRKSILPGISSEGSIHHNHAMLFDPRAKIGNLDGNPVHIDMTEGARLAGSDLTINVVVNAECRIVGAYAGNMEEVLARGTTLVDRMCKVPVWEKADAVVVGAGGCDINFYQAYKALHTALNALKTGGKLILAAECKDGYGNDIFYDWMQSYGRSDEVMRAMGGQFVLGAHKAYLLLKALEKARIVLVTDMNESLVKRLKVEQAPDLQTAINEEINTSPTAKFYVMPKGGVTLPVEP
jgi:nickel-dependent lactate racemase